MEELSILMLRWRVTLSDFSARKIVSKGQCAGFPSTGSGQAVTRKNKTLRSSGKQTKNNAVPSCFAEERSISIIKRLIEAPALPLERGSGRRPRGLISNHVY